MVDVRALVYNVSVRSDGSDLGKGPVRTVSTQTQPREKPVGCGLSWWVWRFGESPLALPIPTRVP